MSTSSPYRALKIFLSYDITSSPDQELFDRLMIQLSTLRRAYHKHAWSDSALSGGSPVLQFIEDRLGTADLIIVLVSPDYLASPRCFEVEMQKALARARSGAAHLIPLLLRPCDWTSTPLKAYQHLPADGIPVSRQPDLDSALAEVAQGIRRTVEQLGTQPAPINSASSSIAIYNLPHIYDNLFTDRKPVLDEIAAFFASKPTGQIPVLALSGPPGIGKTRVAQEYSYRSTQKYHTILWLNASSRVMLSAYLSSLADQLSIPATEREDEERCLAAFKKLLQERSNWLLVLDQMEDLSFIDLLVPNQGSGHALLTTRMQATGGRARSILLESMDINSSSELLLRRAKLLADAASTTQVPKEIVSGVRAIAQEVAGLPLALAQVGAYLEEKGCSPAVYMKLYREQRARLLAERSQFAAEHNESVTSIFTMVFAQVQARNAAYLDLLSLLAFLQPDAIPTELFTKGTPALKGRLQKLVADDFALQQALAELRRFSLLYNSVNHNMLRTHRLIQAVLVESLSAEQRRRWARQAVLLLNQVFPDVRFDTWQDCERYAAQAQHCANLIDTYRLTLKEGALLLERLGFYLTRRASYEEAEKYLIQAVELYAKHLREDPLDEAQTLNSLGLLYSKQGRYSEAEVRHQRSQAIRERVLGPDHPKTAESLHNLAQVYAELADYRRAEQLYLQVLTIEESTKGPDHRDVASTLNNLALVYYQQERYAEAQTLYQRALNIYERTLPDGHPDLIAPLDGLGTLAEIAGDYEQAEQFYARALAISRQAFGEQHPETAHSLNTIAGIAMLRGDYQQAETYYKQALAIAEETLPADNLDAALFLNNLASLRVKQGQDQQAESLYKQSLSIYQRLLGSDYRDTARVRERYAALLERTGRSEEADALRKEGQQPEGE